MLRYSGLLLIALALFAGTPVKAQQVLPINSVGQCWTNGSIGKLNFEAVRDAGGSTRFSIRSFDTGLKDHAYANIENLSFAVARGSAPPISGKVRMMPFGGGNYFIDVEATLTDSQLGTLLASPGRYIARWTEIRVEGSFNNSRKVNYQRTAQIDLSPVFATLTALRACRAKAPPATQAKPHTVAKRTEENRTAQLRGSMYDLFLYEGGRLVRAGITQVPSMTIAVDVNVDGRPKECRVVKSGGSATVDEGVCKIFSRASYSPATDRAARPIVSTLTIEVPSIRLAE